MWLQTFAYDLDTALRALLRRPFFSLFIVTLLAIGITASTAVFTLVDSILLKPLAFERAGELVVVSATQGERTIGMSAANYNDLRDRNHSFEVTAALHGTVRTLQTGDRARDVTGVEVSPSLFRLLNTAPALGRPFEPGDDGVVGLSHQFWQQEFGGRLDVLGDTLRLNGKPHPVVGILSPDFRLPGFSSNTYLVPIGPNANWRRGGSWTALGRLKPGASIERAQSELENLGRQLEAEHPEANKDKGFQAVSLTEWVVGGYRQKLWIFQTAVFLVLLLCCLNAANLLLIRAAREEREIAIRRALGSGGWRLTLQLLLQTGLLSAVAAAAAVLVTWLSVDSLLAWNLIRLPREGEVQVGWSVLLFAASVAMIVSLATTAVPLFRLRGLQVNEQLKSGQSSATAGRRTRRLHQALIGAQVAVALILLAGAGLMLRSFQKYLEVDLGFVPDRQLMVQLQLPHYLYDGGREKQNLGAGIYRQALDAVRQLPGVSAAGLTLQLPLRAGGMYYSIQIEDVESAKRMSAALETITDGTLEALGVPLRRGRLFDESDRLGNRPVALVNEAFVEAFLGSGEEALGRHIKVIEEWREIVGVVGNLRNRGLESAADPALYLPFFQYTRGWCYLLVRTEGVPMRLARLLERQLAAVHPDLQVEEVSSLDDRFYDMISDTRVNNWLFGAFGLVALVLAAVGTFGLMAYSVGLRSREIGVRMAFGAGPGDVLNLVLRQGLGVTVAGLTAGVAAALGLTRYVESMVFVIETTDLAALGSAAGVLLVACLLATLIPGFRAARLNPVRVLREP